MPGISRTRMLKQSQGDPIFGLATLGGLIFRGARALLARGAKRIDPGTALVGSGGSARFLTVVKSKTSALVRRLSRPSLGRRAALAGVGGLGTGAAFEVGGRLARGPGRLVRGPGGGIIELPRRRRMNVLNPKALRRATRRLSGFNKTVQRTQKELRKLCPPTTRRRAPSAAEIHHAR